MKVSDAYKGNYMNVERWPTTPETHTIVAAGVEEDIFSKKEDALLIYVQFETDGPQYRVNRINAKELALKLGKDTDEWIGKRVTIQRVKNPVKSDKKFSWIGIITAAPAKAKKGAKATT